jgi:hypothetical protein
VRLLAAARIGQRRKVVCAAQEDLGEAGFVELRCQLSTEALQRLRESSLPLWVRASFRPLGGEPGVRRRRIVAAQRAA